MTKFLRSFSARRRLAVAFLIVPLLLTSVGFAGTGPLPLPANVDDIQPSELKRHLTFLASQELGGRYTLSSGNRIAARYLASQLESYGYRGAAKDGSFFQKVPFITRTADENPATVTLGEQTFKYGDDFIGAPPVGLPSEFETKAELVFVGFGVSLPEIDSYKGVDVRGKIAVCLPAGYWPKEVGEKKPTGDLRREAATKAGAAAVIVLPDENAVRGWDQFRAMASRRGPRTGGKRPEGAAAPLPAFLAGPTLATRILQGFNLKLEDVLAKGKEGIALEAKGGELCGIRSTVKEAVEYGQNVVGILEGSDPILKKEFIVLSAHYDHLKAEGDKIYPGADDDGSGTSTVLEMARAFSKSKPRRSILVLFNTGEELGLVGSGFFTDQEPLVPLESIVTDFNIDMVGRSRAANDTSPENAKLTDRDGVFVIGADKHSTELMELNEQTNKDVSKLNLDYTYNDENNPTRLFYRSDHWNFAKKGIPIIFYFTGLHVDYHRPTDTVDKIDFEKMARIGRFVYATAWRVANRDQRLKIDRWKKQ
jgi:hypothetical protein